MNKTAIKNFAVWARVQLIEAVKQKAFEYGIKEVDGQLSTDNCKPSTDNCKPSTDNCKPSTTIESEQRKALLDRIDAIGYAQTMEEAAYTWFNRFIALRFMEVNGYLPSKVRVFTDENGIFKPEILKQAISVEIDGLDREKVLDLLDKQDNEELYKYLIITQCNALNAGLPYMFEKIANWTELLFPNNLLRPDSVLEHMVSDIPVEDWNDEVEIIGWMYQYYISQKHEEVVDPLHGKTVKKEDIPAATQLFTTDWVVRYILDNSLGRYWIERHPESKLAEKLTYFMTPKNGVIPTVNENISPEELRVLDPCVGSGHFLSYAFDILLEIYRECGWSDREAAKSILENNLFGLDIDDRAAQLACFAVMMKARKYNRRIISSDTHLHIMAMQDSIGISDNLIRFVAKNDESIKNDLNELRIIFNNAKEYGSIISVPKLDFKSLYARINEISSEYMGNFTDIELQKNTVELLLPLVKQAEILAGKYDVVATNPPYMNKYSPRLKAYIGEHFDAYKGDLFSVFMYRNFDFCKQNGYSGFMTPMVWMFIKTYEALRQFIIDQKSFATLIQFEYSAFEEATVPICSFVLKNGLETEKGIYFKLSDFRGGMEVQKQKILEALKDRENCKYIFEATQSNFSKIPGSPIAYSMSKNLVDTFKFERLDKYANQKMRICTGNNDYFLRLWFETEKNKLFYPNKWVVFNKGGLYRKWFGNRDYVLNYDNNGYELKHSDGFSGGSDEYYFKPGIVWTDLSSGKPSFRFLPEGSIACSAGPMLFVEGQERRTYVNGFLNSCVAGLFANLLCATIHFQWGDIAKFPLKYDLDKEDTINSFVKANISLSKTDWDSFETSWDFKKHPLV